MRPGALAATGLLVTLALAACSAATTQSSSAPTTSAPAATAPSSTGTGTGGVATATSQTPARLAKTTGYATYERCQGTCSGSVPTALRRPLDLPADDSGPCPITINVTGPVSPDQPAAGVGFRRVSGSQWLEAGVTWTAAGSYTGPLLIRGGMLGGGALGFGTGAIPYDELELLDAGQGAPRVAGGGRAWVTDTRIRTGGCYAYQVDGIGFSDVVVFRAVG
jgi:hypothetical protein